MSIKTIHAAAFSLALVTGATLGVSNPAQAADQPDRGMTMEQVKAQFGQPNNIKPAVGNPPITRWIYSDYTVYFEGNLTLDTVSNNLHSIDQSNYQPTVQPSSQSQPAASSAIAVPDTQVTDNTTEATPAIPEDTSAPAEKPDMQTEQQPSATEKAKEKVTQQAAPASAQKEQKEPTISEPDNEPKAAQTPDEMKSSKPAPQQAAEKAEKPTKETVKPESKPTKVNEPTPSNAADTTDNTQNSQKGFYFDPVTGRIVMKGAAANGTEETKPTTSKQEKPAANKETQPAAPKEETAPSGAFFNPVTGQFQPASAPKATEEAKDVKAQDIKESAKTEAKKAKETVKQAQKDVETAVHDTVDDSKATATKVTEEVNKAVESASESTVDQQPEPQPKADTSDDSAGFTIDWGKNNRHKETW